MNKKFEPYLLRQLEAKGIKVTLKQSGTITEAVLTAMRDYYKAEEPDDAGRWTYWDALLLVEDEFLYT
jgi:uncharacterized protein (DUF2267 family)